jgi:putative endonuclease
MSYFIYILQSGKTNHYYIGSAADPNERILRHNTGSTPSTKSGRPWKIVYTEVFSSKAGAIKREIYLKRMKSRTYLENLIKESIIDQGSASVG